MIIIGLNVIESQGTVAIQCIKESVKTCSEGGVPFAKQTTKVEREENILCRTGSTRLATLISLPYHSRIKATRATEFPWQKGP